MENSYVIKPVLPVGNGGRINNPKVLMPKKSISQYDLSHVERNDSVKSIFHELVKKVSEYSLSEMTAGFNKVMDDFQHQCKLQSNGTYEYNRMKLTSSEYYSVVFKFEQYKHAYFDILESR